MHPRVLIAVALVSAWWSAAAGPSAGEDATHTSPAISVDVLSQADPITTKLREALEQPTAIDFVETPLCEAVQFLKEYHKVEIQLDLRALDELGLAADTPITRSMHGVSLRSALKFMLGEIDMTYIIKNQVLLLTTLDAAQDMLSMRIYPVVDLVVLKSGRYSAHPLLQMITSVVEPDSWDDAGGPGSIFDFRGSLVVSQSEEVHEKIDELLRLLRAPAVKRARDAVSDRPLLDDPD